MRRILLAASLLLLASTSAFADTYAFGNRLVVSGDGPGKVIEAAGKPDRIVPIQNKFGAQIGEEWEYYISGKTVTIVFTEGKVSRIRETR